MHWLLTRPEGQNQALAERLMALGQSVTVAPALAVEPCQDAAQAALWQQLSEFTALLFTSINAVTFFAAELQRRQLSWPKVRYLAIGRGTAAQLAQQGQQAESAASGFTSEDLLAQSFVYELAQQSLLLVTGVGGRGLLAPALRARHIHVTRLDVYQRLCRADFVWPQQKVDGLLVTSLESWHCLQNKAALQLRDCMVIAGSERIAASVRTIARTTYTAASPADDDMLAVLQEICS